MSHKKPFSIFHTMHLCQVKQIPKQTTPTVQNCLCSNAPFCLKNNIFEFLSTQIFTMKLEESIKIIFYLTHYPSLLQSFSIFDWPKFPKWCFLTKIITLGRHSFEQWAWQVLDFIQIYGEVCCARQKMTLIHFLVFIANI